MLKRIRKRTQFLNKKKMNLLLKENFFDNSYEVIFRSLSDLIHLLGKKAKFCER